MLLPVYECKELGTNFRFKDAVLNFLLFHGSSMSARQDSLSFLLQPMSLYGSTTQQRVLEIPEILELIFSFLDDESNARNAAVCKRWSELALNTIWRDVSDVRRLFSILAPMRQVPTGRDYTDHWNHYVRRIVLTCVVSSLLSTRSSQEN